MKPMCVAMDSPPVAIAQNTKYRLPTQKGTSLPICSIQEHVYTKQARTHSGVNGLLIHKLYC